MTLLSDEEWTKAVCRGLVAMAEHGLPTDIQELLMAGDPMRGIPPRLFRTGLTAALPIIEAAFNPGWRDINTAPDDGTPVLFGWLEQFEPSKGHIEDGVAGWLDDKWGFIPYHEPPTHWLPLPKGPALANGESRT